MFQRFLLILLLNSFLFADSPFDYEPLPVPEEKKEFIIVKSTKDYKEAKKYAKRVSKLLKFKLDFRGLSFHKSNFLTYSKASCSTYGGYPCYVGRGRVDEISVSVEHTSEYPEFTQGYYIVVVATGVKLSHKLKEVKKIVKDAYIKKAMIYLGCLS